MKVTRHPLCPAAPGLQNIPADEALIRRLEASAAILFERSDVLADRFYHRLFRTHPELRRLFPTDMTNQKKKLVDSLVMVVQNLREPTVVRARLEELGRGHVGYAVQAAHYPLVREALVGAMAEVAGADWNADMHAEWTGAIDLVGSIMLDGAAVSGPSG